MCMSCLLIVVNHALLVTSLMLFNSNNAYRQYAALFFRASVRFHASQAGARAVARRARVKGVGARGLRSIMERLLLDAAFNVRCFPFFNFLFLLPSKYRITNPTTGTILCCCAPSSVLISIHFKLLYRALNLMSKVLFCMKTMLVSPSLCFAVEKGLSNRHFWTSTNLMRTMVGQRHTRNSTKASQMSLKLRLYHKIPFSAFLY
jgi:hypothetical protein